MPQTPDHLWTTCHSANLGVSPWYLLMHMISTQSLLSSCPPLSFLKAQGCAPHRCRPSKQPPNTLGPSSLTMAKTLLPKQGSLIPYRA